MREGAGQCAVGAFDAGEVVDGARVLSGEVGKFDDFGKVGEFGEDAAVCPFDPAAAFAACVNGLRTFLDDTFGAREHHVVLGLSGGIDSALVACVAVAALGPGRVHALTMPGAFTSVGTRTDAEVLARNLGIDFAEVCIGGAADACADALRAGLGLDVAGSVAGQNVQARLRMVMLMAASNAHGWTVLNCGNLSEACMGYCTLYGDTVGAYAPIGGLLKTEVFSVARWLNASGVLSGAGCANGEAREGATGGEVIPESIITRPPSAELAADQTDEESLGITYAMLDTVLAYLLADVPLEDIPAAAAAARDAAALASDAPGVSAPFVVPTPAQVDLVVSRMRTNAFKRAWLPPHPTFARG